MKIVKKYPKLAFVAEKSKIARLVEVIRDKLADHELPQAEHFEAHHRDMRLSETNSLDDIFELDNAQKNPITRLIITCSASRQGASTSGHEVVVGFDSQPSTNVEISVKSENMRWATETISAVEEQVERTFRHDAMHKLVAGEAIGGLAALSLFVLFIFVMILASPRAGPLSKIEKTMWLTKSNLNELEKVLQENPALSNERVSEVVTRQVRNIIAAQKKKGFSLAVLLDWRLLFIAFPILAIIASFVYLGFRCYPHAIFLWGDVEDWYQTIVNRRKNIWTLIVGTLVIGIIANLFVFGLGSFLRQ